LNLAKTMSPEEYRARKVALVTGNKHKEPPSCLFTLIQYRCYWSRWFLPHRVLIRKGIRSAWYYSQIFFFQHRPY
jgi:hypothetical protein